MCGDYNLRREKRYVEVDVRFTPDGKMGRMAGKHPCSRAADADISGQRRNRTGSAVPAEWNPIQIRI